MINVLQRRKNGKIGQIKHALKKKRRQIFIWFCLICVYMIPIVSDYIVQNICTKVAKKELIGL